MAAPVSVMASTWPASWQTQSSVLTMHSVALLHLCPTLLPYSLTKRKQLSLIVPLLLSLLTFSCSLVRCVLRYEGSNPGPGTPWQVLCH